MIKIIITRPEQRSKYTAEMARQMGFEPVLFPLLRLSGLEDIYFRKNLADYNWIIFTSSNAVHYFIDYCNTHKIQIPGNIKIAAVGPQTQKTLSNAGLKANFVPEVYNRTAVSKEIPVTQNDSVLYPAINNGPVCVEQILSKRGCIVERLNVYKSEPVLYTQNEWHSLSNKNPVVITFFSPGTVQAYFTNKPKKFNLKNYTIAVLAQSSNAELNKFGFQAQITTTIPTDKNLLQNIKEYYGQITPS